VADFHNFEEARDHNLEKPVTVTGYLNQSRLLDENVGKMQKQLVHYRHYNPKLFDDLDSNRQFFGKVLQGSQDGNVVTVLHAQRNIHFSGQNPTYNDTLFSKASKFRLMNRLASNFFSNFKEHLQRKIAVLSSTKETLNESKEYFLRCCPKKRQHQENNLNQAVSRLITLRAFWFACARTDIEDC
jgi:hypothetical protein